MAAEKKIIDPTSRIAAYPIKTAGFIFFFENSSQAPKDAAAAVTNTSNFSKSPTPVYVDEIASSPIENVK